MGGGASSYAVAASTMAANDYNQKIAGEIPKLYQLALDRYIKANELEFDKLGAAVEIDKIKQNEYVDALNQFDKDRYYALDGVKTYTDIWNKEDEMADKKAQDERDRALELMEYYQKNGIIVPPEILAQAGIAGHQAQSDQISNDNRTRINNENDYDRAQLAKITFSSSGKKNNNSSKQETEPKQNTSNGKKILNEMTADSITVGGVKLSKEEFNEKLNNAEIVLHEEPDGSLIYVFVR